MANHPSALKRHRQSLKRKARNRSARASMQTSIRKLKVALEGKDAKQTEQALREAVSSIMKKSTKGLLPKRTASRKVARLSAAVHRRAKA